MSGKTPVAFLNTLYQKLYAPAPDYKYNRLENGTFVATLTFNGRKYVTPFGHENKTTAKREVARLALTFLSTEIPDIITTLHGELTRTQLLPKPPRAPKGINNQPPKVSAWWEVVKMANKRPVVYLLEFCQQYKLGQPRYERITDHNGYYMFTLQIGDRAWRGDLAMYAKKKAQDHVADKVFRILYNEQLGMQTQHEAVHTTQFSSRVSPTSSASTVSTGSYPPDLSQLQPVFTYAMPSAQGAFSPNLMSPSKKCVSLLHEIAQSIKIDMPRFEVSTENGLFRGQVKIMGQVFEGNEVCTKKSDAKENVAKLAYAHFVSNGLI